MSVERSPIGPKGSSAALISAVIRLSLRAAIAALSASGVVAAILGGVTGVALLQLTRARGIWGDGEPPDGVAEEVEFTSASDRTRLSGWFLRADAVGMVPTIIICHGIYTGRREGLPWALSLRELGFNVLCFDFRAHGRSGGSRITVGYHEADDVLGAVQYVLSRPEVTAGQIGVLGFSMGAAAAIIAAARSRDIGAIVADSSYATFVDAMYFSFNALFGRLPKYPFVPVAVHIGRWIMHVDADQMRPVTAIERLAGRPLLLIHGADDEIVPARHAHLLFAAAYEPKELWIVPLAHHVEARDLDPARYLERVSAFFHAAFSQTTPALHAS